MHAGYSAGMSRQRVLLLETDSVLQSVLRDLFADEELDVSVCASLVELQTLVSQYPHAAVVSDSWTAGEYQTLSAQHRAEIQALSEVAEVVLTTGADWARHIRRGEFGTVEIVEKPYTMDQLLLAVRAALARAASTHTQHLF
jgi:DNA-binding NtrC family response regulator